MARIWQEGFEIRRHSGHFAQLYEANPSSPSFQAGRLTGFSLNGPTGGSATATFRTVLLPAHQRYTAGIAAQINNPSTSTATPTLFLFLDSGTEQIGVHVIRSGSTVNYTLRVVRGPFSGGVTLHETSLILGGDGYQYFEFQALIAPSGGTWELRMNGAVISIGTGNTRHTANSSCNQFQFKASGGSGAQTGTNRCDYDDIYLNDGSGTLNTGFSGDTVIEGLLPNAAGAQTDWISEANGSPSGVPNWDQVDDPATTTPNNDSGYVVSNTVGAVDLYNFTDLQFITGPIQALMFVARARIEATGARVLGLRYRDVSTSQADLDDVANVNNATYDEKVFITETNPTTSSLFSVAQIQGMQVGPKVLS
jgi:hypothetical protein